jgi:hypothetical protein
MSDNGSIELNEISLHSPGQSGINSMDLSSNGDFDRSPSPAERSPKRRRLHSPSHNGNEDFSGLMNGHLSSDPASSSSSSLPDRLGLPQTFLGQNREYLSLIMSQRGVERVDTQPRVLSSPLSAHSMLQQSPVAAADNMHFIGWRDKIETWPTDDGRHIRRCLTSVEEHRHVRRSNTSPI